MPTGRALQTDRLFRCCSVPMALNSPATMIAIRVQSASHSAMLCVVSTMDRPLRIICGIRDCNATETDECF